MENNFFVSFSITNIQQQTAPGLRVEKINNNFRE
tara:strand:+ start:1841 stop:1942 length:102 start_codon:yes stop_codon:yes gene_type:complete